MIRRRRTSGWARRSRCSASVLSVTGEAEVGWDDPEAAAFAGAERLLRLRVTEGVWLERAAPLRWSPPRLAPELMATGTW